ncbi:MAG: SRPBCC family protein [Myxococcota bacterium]
MRKLTAITVGLLLTGAIATGARAENAAATSLAAQLGDRIKRGSAPERGEDVSWGTALGVVEAPVEAVTRIAADYSNYSEFVPHFKKSRVLSRRGNDALVYMEAGVLKDTVTLWAQVRISARTRGERRIIESRMLKGNMDTFRARWELIPVAGNTRTLVKFHLLVDPDLPLPDSVLSRENEKSAGKTLRAMRDRVRHKGLAVANNR